MPQNNNLSSMTVPTNSVTVPLVPLPILRLKSEFNTALRKDFANVQEKRRFMILIGRPRSYGTQLPGFVSALG